MEIKEVTVRLPEPPSANHYWEARALYRNGKWIAQVYTTPAAKEYQALAHNSCLAQIPGDKPTFDKSTWVGVSVLWVRSELRRDMDGILKVLLDVLQGAIYANDRQVHRLQVMEVLDREETHPHVLVRVYRLTEADLGDAKVWRLLLTSQLTQRTGVTK